MYGRACEGRKTDRHMRTGLDRCNSVVAGDVPSSSSSLSPVKSFCKGGRKIRVGDCALFKPPQGSPPFIGIIRSLTTGKEDKLNLCVNWLYRPGEVKLGKGIPFEAAPNELFYSFHRDEIPAASLLHPCKVAFLAKGVELPSRICSFVCWRVYDITNKCLWWLTDPDYIKERQEEVDQLLYKTHIEMLATSRPGGRSPKPTNGPTSTSQLKPGSDNVHNSASSFPSQAKGKKRERGDKGSEPIKRERYSKTDDGDSTHSRPESIWRSEIAKFTENGGLADSEGVEKLVQLMLPEKNEKIDLVGRSVLAGVVAATDNFDCLNRFVQLRGLPVFDEWLQEVHKGKIGDGSGTKECEKSIEEFLLVLLRALDKLPVNLHALQMCNIGKSVNHLRSHRNLEIQKKSRSLVDTWKRRVEAEMDAKSGSYQAVPWTARPRLPEVSHGGNRHSGVSSEVAMKTSASQLSALRNAPVKLVQVDNTTKSGSPSPGSMKSASFSASVGNNLKEGQPRNTSISGGCDPPLTAGDEKSSSSSQSHNNSQSCSSDPTKTVGYSGKEDSRSSTAISVSANKMIGSSSRHRKSMNGFPGPASSGIQKETLSSRNSSLHRNPGSEILPQSSLTCEKVVDVPLVEGNNHKLIVKLSNRGRSPARSVSGGSSEDPSIMDSRASSPILSEKHDQFDHNLKEKNDAYQANIISDVNNESWQSNDFKEVLTGSDAGDGSPATVLDEDNCRTGDDARKLAEVSKAAFSSTGNEQNSGKRHDASFSSINALIESCVKYSEANVSMSVGDDVGMNLLASVAAGEISKSDTASPIPSPQRNIAVVGHSCTSIDSRLKSPPGGRVVPEQGRSVDDEHEKRSIYNNSLGKNTETEPVSCSQEKPTEELSGHLKSSVVDVQQVADPFLRSKVKSEETFAGTSSDVPSALMAENTSDSGRIETWEEKSCGKSSAVGPAEATEELCETENKANVSGVVGTEVVVGSSSYLSVEIDSENKNIIINELNISLQAEQKTPAMHSESVKGNVGEVLHSSDSGRDIISENVDVAKAEKADETAARNQTPGKKTEENNIGFAAMDRKVDCVESSECNVGNEQNTDGLMPSSKVSPTVVLESEQQASSRGCGIEADECISVVADAGPSSAAGEPDMEAKVQFDLNEGFNSDDGRYWEPSNFKAPECSTAIQLASPLPLPVSCSSSGLPASITVASAAKRPFVPPQDLLRNKGELGWKGSAATSAFRPAEPRKTLEALGSTSSVSLPVVAAPKPSRPPLDIDLNIPDQRILEDIAYQSSAHATSSISDLTNYKDLSHDKAQGSFPVRNSGGLELDLNKVDEPIDISNHLSSNVHRLDMQLQQIKSSSGIILNRRDFDLNDGPFSDEMSVEPSAFSQHNRSSVPSHPSVSGLQMNSTEMGNFSSWFPQGNPYSAVTIQSILPDRGEQPLPMVTPGGPPRMLVPPAGSTQFSPDVYRASVLTSSAAVPFPSTPFQYPVFPFGSNFAIPSATFSCGSTTYVDSSSGGRLCFPAMHSQVLAPAGAVPPHYPRPFVVSLPDGNNNTGGTEGIRKWGRQGLDLNSGPLGADIEMRDETSSLASRQLSITNSRALAEEQSRMYQVAGGGLLKRNEQDGGWEGYKQSSWQ